MSNYVVQEEPFERVADEVVALFHVTRGSRTSFERFSWLYQQNPDGPAVVWTVRTTADGELAGFTAGLPRRMYVHGTVALCWNTSDFSIAPAHRTLGVAAKLRKAATEGVQQGRVEFLYGHPNARMAAVHERAGHTRVGTMQRYACPLRSLPYLRRQWPVSVAAPALSPVADLALRALHPWTWHRPRFCVRLSTPASFGEEFDALDDRCRMLRPLMGVRDSRYLTWRYTAGPLYVPVVATAREGKRLLGYAVAVCEDELLQLKDVLWDPAHPEAAEDALALLMRWARQRGFSSVSVSLLDGHPLEGVLQANHFRPRAETSAMYAHARPGGLAARLIGNPSNWFISVGDRDV
jgi:RimJ/RimL family protein N-acetyltransferase